MTYLQAIILAIVEGLTEFLPVSSTGHMVITSSLMGISSSEFTKMFEVVIQFGAILSVVVLYWRRFLQSFDFYIKLAVAFLPAAVFGVLLYKQVKAALESPTLIAVVLLVGGIILLFVDDWFIKNENNPTDASQEITYKKALTIGGFQVLAMILPGLSRSAATIVGGLTQKLTRQRAAEFSFFLAVPTMAAATLKEAYEFWKGTKLFKIDPTDIHAIAPLSSQQWGLLAIGNIVAFIVAVIAIRTFIGFLTKNGFKMFGYYRIVIGLLILILQAIGVEIFIH